MKRETERFAWSTCTCGKRAYMSRRAAKRRAKVQHPDDSNLNVYRCLLNPQAWHYGHLGPDGRDFYREAS